MPLGTADESHARNDGASKHWGRHPATKVAGFASFGAMAFGTQLVAGDGGILLMGGGAIVAMGLSIAAAVEHMRGRVQPSPGRNLRAMSPIAGVCWASAALLGGAVAVAFVVIDDEEPSGLIKAGVLVAGLIAVLGVIVQILSLSDRWPDRWRPPYAGSASSTDIAGSGTSGGTKGGMTSEDAE